MGRWRDRRVDTQKGLSVKGNWSSREQVVQLEGILQAKRLITMQGVVGV